MEDTERHLGFLLNDVARLLRRDFNRKAEDIGLSQAQWRALAYLSRREGVKQVTLAESLEVKPMTLARLIDRLEESGLVTRRPDPDDRRAFRLYLTEAAQPLLSRMHELARETRGNALTGLPEEQRQTLIDCLVHMKARLLEPETGPAEKQRTSEGAASRVSGTG